MCTYARKNYMPVTWGQSDKAFRLQPFSGGTELSLLPEYLFHAMGALIISFPTCPVPLR